jgi:hypothetical protein
MRDEVAVPPQRVLRFGRGEDGNAALREGWGQPEDGFVWSEGKYAQLLVNCPESTKSIGFSVWGYSPEIIGSQDLLVFVEGLLTGFFRVAGKAILQLNLPPNLNGKFLHVSLYVPSAASPSKIEGKNDYRELGIALSAIRFDPT